MFDDAKLTSRLVNITKFRVGLKQQLIMDLSYKTHSFANPCIQLNAGLVLPCSSLKPS